MKKLTERSGILLMALWMLAAIVAVVSASLSVWLRLSGGASRFWILLPAALCVAMLVWTLHLRRLPAKGALFPCCGSLPPPALWVALLSAVVAWFELWLGYRRAALSETPAVAAMSVMLALVLYALLLPRLLACLAKRRPAPAGQIAAAVHIAPSGRAAPAAALSSLLADTISAITTPQFGNVSGSDYPSGPWVAPIHDGDRIKRIFRWIASPENPITHNSDDLFDVKAKVSRLLDLLRPASAESGAGTVSLLGPRGSGKSTLLRLAAEEEARAGGKNGVIVRFCFLSLWEYSNASAALRGLMDEVLEAIRDRVDILPIAGMPAGIVRAVFGTSGIPDVFRGISPPSLDLWLPALSELLIRANMRVILCIEDDDRIVTAARRAEHSEIMQGFLDRLKGLPGFGYVICTSIPAPSEPSPGDADSGAMDGKGVDPSKWDDYNKRWRESADRTGQNRNGIDPMQAPQLTPAEMSGLRDEINMACFLKRSQWAKDIACLPVSRLCQYDLILEKCLNQADLEALFRTFRLWMVQQIRPEVAFLGNASPFCAVETADRQQLFDIFLKDRSDYGLAAAITPRTLRNALRDAHRHWVNIVRQLEQGGEGWQDEWVKSGIDFDSVLVACLLRACRPELWPGFLETECYRVIPTSYNRNLEIMTGSQGPFSLHGKIVEQFEQLPEWCGLSPAVKNMLLRDSENGKEIRPGGIIGKKSKKNWELFVNS